MLEFVLVCGAVVLLVWVVALWVVGLVLRDVSVMDVGWGLGFMLVGWTGFLVGDGTIARRALVVTLVSVWGLRLTVHLLVRKRKDRPEDPRYATLRARYGARFPLVSLAVVFLFQGALLWIVSLPLQRATASSGRITPVDGVGAAIWASGLFFEAVGDEQLRRFKASVRPVGTVMSGGLWRYTRHPNYFGDFLVWWGMFLVGIAPGASGWWTVVGPIVMSVLLLKVSGKALLERQLLTRPGYADYVSTTSGFVPWPRRRSSR